MMNKITRMASVGVQLLLLLPVLPFIIAVMIIQNLTGINAVKVVEELMDDIRSAL
jgi:hypothetical protein